MRLSNRWLYFRTRLSSRPYLLTSSCRRILPSSILRINILSGIIRKTLLSYFFSHYTISFLLFFIKNKSLIVKITIRLLVIRIIFFFSLQTLFLLLLRLCRMAIELLLFLTRLLQTSFLSPFLPVCPIPVY